jgi:hypothetical protein
VLNTACYRRGSGATGTTRFALDARSLLLGK